MWACTRGLTRTCNACVYMRLYTRCVWMQTNPCRYARARTYAHNLHKSSTDTLTYANARIYTNSNGYNHGSMSKHGQMPEVFMLYTYVYVCMYIHTLHTYIHAVYVYVHTYIHYIHKNIPLRCFLNILTTHTKAETRAKSLSTHIDSRLHTYQTDGDII